MATRGLLLVVPGVFRYDELLHWLLVAAAALPYLVVVFRVL